MVRNPVPNDRTIDPVWQHLSRAGMMQPTGLAQAHQQTSIFTIICLAMSAPMTTHTIPDSLACRHGHRCGAVMRQTQIGQVHSMHRNAQASRLHIDDAQGVPQQLAHAAAGAVQLCMILTAGGDAHLLPEAGAQQVADADGGSGRDAKGEADEEEHAQREHGCSADTTQCLSCFNVHKMNFQLSGYRGPRSAPEHCRTPSWPSRWV